MEKFVCFGCFAERMSPLGPCPCCGYDDAVGREEYPIALAGGTILNGRYIVGKVLGQGGFGITYIAQDHQTKNLVAIKEFFPGELASRTDKTMVLPHSSQQKENFSFGLQCFLDEAKTLAEFIGNPNIVRVYSFFEENNTAYFVMEYVEGVSLQRYTLQKGGRLSWEEASTLLQPIMDALQAVHAKGIIHRDVTPDNIVIANDGSVKLLDFGAARYSLGDKSRSLDVVLKHGFAPKEQYTRRGRQGPYTDVYALAATYYFVLTGRIPPEAIDRMDEDDLILPSSFGVMIPEASEDALEKALSVQPADRFQTMGEFKNALAGRADSGYVQEPYAVTVTRDAPKPLSRTVPADPPISRPEQKPISEEKVLPRSTSTRSNGKTEKRSIFWKLLLMAVLALLPVALVFLRKSGSDPKPDLEQTIQTNADIDVAMTTEAPTVPSVVDFLPVQNNISAKDGGIIAAIKKDGTVVVKSLDADIPGEVGKWTDIVAVSASGMHIIGQKSDGTVVSAGINVEGACDVAEWEDIVAISTGAMETIGVKSDGTVVIAGGLIQKRKAALKEWKDIVQVSCVNDAVGVKSDGTVVATGDFSILVKDWTDIVSVSAYLDHVVGLKSDGTVVAAGENEFGRCNVEDWTDIVAISTNAHHTIGLKSDGTVVATGDNEFGRCNVEDWTDIVAVSAGATNTVGLKSDGTLVSTSVVKDIANEAAQEWTDLCTQERKMEIKSQNPIKAENKETPKDLIGVVVPPYEDWKVNIRDMPSVSGTVVTKLANGTEVIICESIDDWYRIEEGWIRKEYVMLLES